MKTMDDVERVLREIVLELPEGAEFTEEWLFEECKRRLKEEDQ